MCNIVCNGHNDNPVCGSDGVTYETPCHVREASCLKQLKIDIRHVGRCQGNEETQHCRPINRRRRRRGRELGESGTVREKQGGREGEKRGKKKEEELFSSCVKMRRKGVQESKQKEVKRKRYRRTWSKGWMKEENKKEEKRRQYVERSQKKV